MQTPGYDGWHRLIQQATLGQASCTLPVGSTPCVLHPLLPQSTTCSLHLPPLINAPSPKTKHPTSAAEYEFTQACHRGILLIPQLRAGKYKPGGPRPYGPRGALFNESRLREVAPLISLIEAVGKEKGKSPAQVRLPCAQQTYVFQRLSAAIEQWGSWLLYTAADRPAAGFASRGWPHIGHLQHRCVHIHV